MASCKDRGETNWGTSHPGGRPLQLVVSPRDSHENPPALWGGTQDTDFYIGKCGGCLYNCIMIVVSICFIFSCIFSYMFPIVEQIILEMGIQRLCRPLKGRYKATQGPSKNYVMLYKI